MARHSVNACDRCRTPTDELDRLSVHFDSDSLATLYADLCRTCSNALKAWVNPPEDVRESWAARRLGVER